MSGQYNGPALVVAFNAIERWSEDVSQDVAREVMRHLGLAGDELPGVRRTWSRTSARVAAGVS
jgi:hypothetical protein